MKPTPASKRDLLQQYAFADERLRSSVPREPDTKSERELFLSIQGHIQGWGGQFKISAEQCSMIKSFLSSGKYRDVFPRPTTSRVSRRMAVNKAWLSTTLGKDSLEREGSEKRSFWFKPFSNASSWTWNSSYSHTVKQREYVVTMVAETGGRNRNSFFAVTDEMYDRTESDQHSHECEVIGLGDIRVAEISWYTDTYEKL